MNSATESPPNLASEKAPRLDGTIVKGLALIEYLAEQNQAMGVSAIAQHFGWQKSNVHRLLGTFKALGYVRQDPATSRYELSLKTWELGMKVVGRSTIKRAAQPFMRQLHQRFAESVNVSILVGGDVLYLDNILSNQPLRPTASPGARVPAVFTASGKSQLAWRPDAEAIARDIIASNREAASIRLETFLQDLEKVRQRGYATSVSGWRNNVNSVAAPILNSEAQSIAAIGISGPAERMTPDKFGDMGTALMHAAAEIAAICGGR